MFFHTQSVRDILIKLTNYFQWNQAKIATTLLA